MSALTIGSLEGCDDWNVPRRIGPQPGAVLRLTLPLLQAQPALGLPPTATHVLRCRYGAAQRYTAHFMLYVAEVVASALKHLHSRHIAHGDMWAPPTLVLS